MYFYDFLSLLEFFSEMLILSVDAVECIFVAYKRVLAEVATAFEVTDVIVFCLVLTSHFLFKL